VIECFQGRYLRTRSKTKSAQDQCFCSNETRFGPCASRTAVDSLLVNFSLHEVVPCRVSELAAFASNAVVASIFGIDDPRVMPSPISHHYGYTVDN
jgi:hypothetical protein